MTLPSTSSQAPQESQIDMRPTWGEIGLRFMRVALSNQQEAIKAMRSEVARAMAAAEALTRIQQSLSEEQHRIVSETLQRELTKQGF